MFWVAILWFLLVLVGIGYLRRADSLRDETLNSEPFEPTGVPDPYSVAFLRGGETEAAKTAFVQLVELGAISTERNRSDLTEEETTRARGHKTRWVSDQTYESVFRSGSLLRQVYDVFLTPKSMGQLALSSWDQTQAPEIVRANEWAHQERLLAGRDHVDHAMRVRNITLVATIVVGCIGLFICVMKREVGDLRSAKPDWVNAFVWGVITVVTAMLTLRFLSVERLTKRGKDYLSKVQHLYGSPQLFSASYHRDLSSGHDQPYDWTFTMLAMGLFGTESLKGTELESVYESDHRLTESSGETHVQCSVDDRGETLNSGVNACPYCDGSLCGGGGCHFED